MAPHQLFSCVCYSTAITVYARANRKSHRKSTGMSSNQSVENPVDIPPDKGYNENIEGHRPVAGRFPCQLLKEVTALCGRRGGYFLFSLGETISL